MTKAEKAAEAMVETFFRDFIDPGEYAGPNLDKNTWNPWSLIRVHLWLSYASGNVPKTAEKKAHELVEREWGKRLTEWQSRSKTIT